MTYETPVWYASIADEIMFEPGQSVGAAFEDCAHGCKHPQLALTAIGPDVRRFKLLRCVCVPCTRSPEIQCRAWFTQRDVRWGPFRSVYTGRTA